MSGPACPQCGAVHSVKNGRAHTGKQRYLCRACGYQFTLNPTQRRITPEQEAEVGRLLAERISHRGICRATGVSRSWFRQYLIRRRRAESAGAVPAEAAVQEP